MTFEAFEVELGHAVRDLENERQAADLRYDVAADAAIADGKAWRTCLAQQPATFWSASGPVTVARTWIVRQTVANASVRWSCVPILGVVHARAGATSRVPDGSHDPGRDERAVDRARHLVPRAVVVTVCPSC